MPGMQAGVNPADHQIRRINRKSPKSVDNDKFVQQDHGILNRPLQWRICSSPCPYVSVKQPERWMNGFQAYNDIRLKGCGIRSIHITYPEDCQEGRGQCTCVPALRVYRTSCREMK